MTATVRALLLLSLLALVGCAGAVRNPVPAEHHLDTTLLGRTDLRFWDRMELPASWQQASEATAADLRKRYATISGREHNYLAISGGGANGAYGAGLLVGWSERGTRPEFTMVTGISTGALTAPFAFLGRDYDDELKHVYTTLDTEHILRLRSVSKVVRGDAVADVTPLIEVLEKYVDEQMIARIAAEFRSGRMLIIGTTNLDAGRAVFWNIGRIADSGHPDAPGLIRMILRASASIPGVFPPVYIPVQGPDGRTYDEMHVDGGTSAQMFLYPSGVEWDTVTDLLDVQGRPSAYLIRNSYVTPQYEPVPPRLAPIIGKTVGSLIRTQGIGDAYRIYTLAQRDGIDVRVTWIPNDSVDVEPTESFDPDYMSALFEFGYRRALEGEPFLDVESVIEGN